MPHEPPDQKRYLEMCALLHTLDDTLPGKLEITNEGIVHDATAPNAPHELTVLRIRRRLEQVMPNALVAYTGAPDVEDEPNRILRRPDVMLIAEADMAVEGSFDPRTASGTVLTGIHATPPD